MTLLVLDLSAGALWFGNRNAFEVVRRTDHPHTWLSLAELAFVALAVTLPLIPLTGMSYRPQYHLSRTSVRG